MPHWHGSFRFPVEAFGMPGEAGQLKLKPWIVNCFASLMSAALGGDG